jgi:hypothetical protein
MPGLFESRAAVRRLAPLTLLPAAAFAVHQLRYWLAYGPHAGAMLQRQGHAYLHSVVPWLALLLALAAGVFLCALGRAFGGHSSTRRYTVSFLALWLACAACLVAIYSVQELLEALFASGHPVGFSGIFGYGGWWSIPASLCIGLVLAAVLHGARWALAAVADRHTRRPVARRRLTVQARAPRAVLVPRPAPVAVGWSLRGPPS